MIFTNEPTIPEMHCNLLQNPSDDATRCEKEFLQLNHVQEKIGDTFDGSLTIS